MKFYIYNFMKKYTLNFTTTTAQGTKKIPPRKTLAGFVLIGSVIKAALPWVSGDRNHRSDEKRQRNYAQVDNWISDRREKRISASTQASDDPIIQVTDITD